MMMIDRFVLDAMYTFLKKILIDFLIYGPVVDVYHQQKSSLL